MAELGLIAAVVQVADVGFRLSEKLYTFSQTVASADESILFISKDISYTCCILRALEHSLKKDREAESYSQNAVSTAETIVKECRDIFQEIDRTLSKKIRRIGLDGTSSRFAVSAIERLRWPFLRPRMMELCVKLDTLKSSLHLMLSAFIYARLVAERNGEPSVINDLRSMIENLLRTNEEQSLNNESLKAARDCNEDTDGTRAATNGCIPGISDPYAGTMPKQAPGKSRIERLLQAPKMESTTEKPDNYQTLIEHIMAKVEAEEYNIEPDMRRRIRDDVIRTLEREAGRLRAVHGHTQSKGKMREKPRKLTEMANEEADIGEQAQIQQGGDISSGAEPFPSDLGAQIRYSDPNHSSQEGIIQKQITGYEHSPAKARPRSLSRVHAPEISTVELFLDDREGPRNHLHLLLGTPLVDKPRFAKENGWLPYWASGASMRAFHKILPLNPLKAQMSFWHSCTSMLVTEQSHDLESIASSQDLAALTDSTDTDTFVSARSEFGDVVLGTSPLCRLEEGEKDGLLAILDGLGCSDAAGKYDGTVGVAKFDQYMDQLLAS